MDHRSGSDRTNIVFMFLTVAAAVFGPASGAEPVGPFADPPYTASNGDT